MKRRAYIVQGETSRRWYVSGYADPHYVIDHFASWREAWAFACQWVAS